MFVIRRSFGLRRLFNSSKSGIEDTIKSKGKTEEDIYFSRKDKEALKKLMDKIDHSITEEASSPEAAKKHRDSLLNVIKKHNLRPSEALVDDLMVWRSGH